MTRPPISLTPQPTLSSGKLLAGRKQRGGGICLLFELCVLQIQSQNTLIQVWLFISSQYPCRRKQTGCSRFYHCIDYRGSLELYASGVCVSVSATLLNFPLMDNLSPEMPVFCLFVFNANVEKQNKKA